MTHEQFITLETAKLAKKAGFDWECLIAYYTISDGVFKFHTSDNNIPVNWNQHKDYYSVPTQAVLQRWLREVKKIQVETGIGFTIEDSIIRPAYYVYCTSTNYYNSVMIDCTGIKESTPEAALEAGLQRCLTLIIEKQ